MELQEALYENRIKDAIDIVEKENISVKKSCLNEKRSQTLQKLLRSKDPDAINLLNTSINKGLKPRGRFKGGFNFLHISAVCSPPDMFMNFLEKQPKLRTARDSGGNTPFHLFAERKDVPSEYIEEINQKFPQLQLEKNKEGQTPIIRFLNAHNPNNYPEKNNELLDSLKLYDEEKSNYLNKKGTYKAVRLGYKDEIFSYFNRDNLITKAKKDEIEDLSETDKKNINDQDS